MTNPADIARALRPEVRIDVCCNDPDNGLFAHRAAMISVGDDLELAANDFRGPTFRELGDKIRISRRMFSIGGSREWVGNWCWNSYWMREEIALDFLEYVHRTEAFSCEMATVPLAHLWAIDGPWHANTRETFREHLFPRPTSDASTDRTPAITVDGCGRKVE